MLTAKQIQDGKNTTKYSLGDVLHEHDDCIRIAYQWLDAQTKTKNTSKRGRPLKHIIEKWGGRYVSQSDVEVAAHMHPDIIGKYPHFNISARLVEPSQRRLTDISEAKTQEHNQYSGKVYSSTED